MAIADLGGLGAKEGAPVSYRWTPPSLVPRLLPWLIILLLLLLRPNRCASAWWIWLPLGCVAGLGRLLQPTLDFLPSELMDMFLEADGALAFGLAAVWLLAPHLVRRHRFVTFLCLLLALAGFSFLVFLVRQDWTDGGYVLALQVSILLALNVFVASVALTLAGLACRGRYRPLCLSVCLMASLLVVWLIIAAPFFILALVTSGGRLPWLEFFSGVLAVAGVGFATMLPFLILSFASALFRERLKGLLHLGREVPPPVIAPIPSASPAT